MVPQNAPPPIQLTTPCFPIELSFDLTSDLVALGFIPQWAQLCSVDLSHAPSGGSYTGAFLNPDSGAFLSMFLTNPNPGSAFAVTSPVGPDSDLLLIFVRQ